MHDAVAAVESLDHQKEIGADARVSINALAEISLVTGSALLTILSFPDFDLWPLAWVGLVPLLLVIAQPLSTGRALILGWWWGVIFFYGTCWWLTYPMIHYAHFSAWLAYPLLLLPVALVSVFPALFCALQVRLVSHFGQGAIFIAPLTWVSIELARYAVSGQLWNALGYSQAFHPVLVQSARWGGVYAVSLLILMTNAALAFVLIRQTVRAIAPSFGILIIVAVAIAAASFNGRGGFAGNSVVVAAVQPNVPMEGVDDAATMKLLNRHLELGSQVLSQNHRAGWQLVIWPESPMNFSYSRDPHLQSIVANFARTNGASVLLNSLEPAPNDGSYNSAVMINQEGKIVAQYDKIRLMPFGEYVPLPRWLPGASSVRSIVGDFTPGSSYTLMPLGDLRAGVFICIEAAHPGIARTFAREGAEVLINISNDGYLGPTPVMRQHLANAIFRAVENDRPLLRVTNTGISAYIAPNGSVWDRTPGFQEAVRIWTISKGTEGTTFYSRHGDLFVYACAVISLGIISATFMTRRSKVRNLVKRQLSDTRP